MRSVFFIVIALAAAAAPSEAAGADLTGRAVAATCSNCHAASGHRAIPALEGRPEAELQAALDAFRSGRREGTVMPQLAKGYTEAQLAAVARWYGTQKAPTLP